MLNQSHPDPRVRMPVLPTRVVWKEGNVNSPERLLENDLGQSIFHGPPPFTTMGAGSSILLDFGHELHGGVQLVTSWLDENRSIPLRLRFGESASEAMHEPINHHSRQDMDVLMPPLSSQEFGQTGYRFLRIDVLDDARDLRLLSCRAMTLMRELPHVGAFQCSDERLNEIWRVGADTVHLCLQDFVWDGIKRDRAVWIGDLHPEAAVVNAVWGELDVVAKSLDLARDHTPLPKWMNGIGSYSMWWVILHHEWYWAHGNREYLETQREYLNELIPVLIEQIQNDGSVLWRERKFLDWPSSENPEAINAGLVALLKLALGAAIRLFQVLGETASADLTMSALKRLQTPKLPESSKQASALLGLSGLYDVDFVNSNVLAREPLSGLSTFYGYYVLQARAAAGDYEGSLDVIRRYWGAMIDLGATSFWEDFDLSWSVNAGRIDELPIAGKRDVHRDYGDYCYKGLRHSLCHGWAAGPTAWLSEHVLGVKALEPGCRKVSIRPMLCDLQWVEGAYPTPHGPIQVRCRRLPSGDIDSEIHAPNEVEVVR